MVLYFKRIQLQILNKNVFGKKWTCERKEQKAEQNIAYQDLEGRTEYNIPRSRRQNRI
jgi:hypothetical protein